jgi:hypothetical protein
MAFRVVVRNGAKVERLTAATLDDALRTLENYGRGLAAQPRRHEVDVGVKQFAPADQVAARVELSGPQRWRPDVKAGIDVRGDGKVQAWTGAPSRERVEAQKGESPYDALRRALQSASVDP